jgi:hypothetical protein
MIYYLTRVTHAVFAMLAYKKDTRFPLMWNRWKYMFAKELSAPLVFYLPKLASVSLMTSIMDLAVQRSRPL